MSRNATSPEFSRVCEALPRLTAGELEQVRLRLGFLTDGDAKKSAPAPDRRNEHDWLLRGLDDELRRRGVLGRGSASYAVHDWPRTSRTVREDLLAALGGRHDPRRLAAFGGVVARALAVYLEGGGVPVTPKTLLTNAPKALAALDAQFPGYAEAGLLACVLDPQMVGAD